jgi:transcriptional regulator with XRE-family HTH domain
MRSGNWDFAILTLDPSGGKMFAMEKSVRQRTISFPANEAEEAVYAVLRTIRTSTGAARDLIAQGEAEATELAEVAEEIGGGVASLLQRWRLLDRGSPYRSASLDEAANLVEDVIARAEAAGGNTGIALSLESELAALVLAQARASAAEQIATGRGSRSLRSLAAGTGLALGYLSDLEAGRRGPPSDDVCRKLEVDLDIELLPAVAEARQRAEELKRRHRQRRARARRMPLAKGKLPREDTRLAAVAVAVADDPRLLELLDAVRQLPPSARRGVEQLVKELTQAFAKVESGGRHSTVEPIRRLFIHN